MINSKSLISLVVPVFNEQESIEIFYDAVVSCLDNEKFKFEIIFVDDGSFDSTFEIIAQLSETDSRVKFVKLSRNFGKEAALTAGLKYANGNAVVPIDVDLQDPVETVLRFFVKWQEGYDVVFGKRAERRYDTSLKKITAERFYKVFNKFSNIQIPENTGDFRLMDRKVVDVINALPEKNRFMKGIFTWVGFKTTECTYERAHRAAGASKWNYWKLWNFALDGIFSFSSIPLRVWSYVGALFSLLSFGYASFLILKTIFMGSDVPGYASIMTAVLFLGGMQLFSIGIIGEYIARIMTEVKNRPAYIVEMASGDES